MGLYFVARRARMSSVVAVILSVIQPCYTRHSVLLMRFSSAGWAG